MRLSDSQSITDSTGIALPAGENNASVPGTLANRIEAERNKTIGKMIVITDINAERIEYEYSYAYTAGQTGVLNVDTYFKNAQQYESFLVYKINQTISLRALSNAVLSNGHYASISIETNGDVMIYNNESSGSFNVREQIIFRI